ncbi:MAG: hypothetical protein ACK4GN_15800, partial [Runella sp.]
VKDSPNTQAFAKPLVAPKWISTETHSANVCIKYPASQGYVSYTYRHDAARRSITYRVAGNSGDNRYHLLLPDKTQKATIKVNGKPIDYTLSQIEASNYADFEINHAALQIIEINY